jgi:hypothetical protein
MKLSFGVGALVAVWSAACSSAPSSSELTAITAAAIQNGATDPTHSFVVAVLQNSNQVALCSGSLLAPNLVATARHCVTTLTGPPQIDCATSVFGSVLPPSDLVVTNDEQISTKGHFFGVTKIIVPTGAQQDKVCGNDIALLILDRNVVLPQYVTPTISPPMTDPKYSISVTAIGYGIDSPTDMSGTTAGVRRIIQNVSLACVPNDTSFFGCYSGPQAAQVLSPNEFLSGDASTCEGDSGSGAFDQGSFDRGTWVSFGVLSRGAVNADGGSCIQPIYSRFDAWAQLISGAAQTAAAMGGYAVPAWAMLPGTPVVDAAAPSGPPALLQDGMVCGGDNQCRSNACLSTDNVNFFCSSACEAGACSAGFGCVQGYCFPTHSAPALDGGAGATATALAHKSGCSMGGAPSNAPSRLSFLATAGIMTLVFVRRRKSARPWGSSQVPSGVGFQTRSAAVADACLNREGPRKCWDISPADPPKLRAGMCARDLLNLH